MRDPQAVPQRDREADHCCQTISAEQAIMLIAVDISARLKWTSRNLPQSDAILLSVAMRMDGHPILHTKQREGKLGRRRCLTLLRPANNLEQSH